MANPEHAKILEQGNDVWSAWRGLNPELAPDLREAILGDRDLSEMDLSRADLTGAYLHGSSLVGADLRGATLELADLRGAQCYAANLEGAFLQGASLFEADLSGVILRGAQLIDASLEYATFDNTDAADCDFSNATIHGTKFVGMDLSKATGLDLIRHMGPSSIDIDTFYASGGKLSEPFLRGCGVSDEFIAYARSLVAAGKAIQFYSCFISYSSKDQDFAERLYADLQNKSVRCWFAPEDLKIGDKIRDRIDESIRLRDKLLLILTESSIASDWVEHEVESALEEEKQRGRTILFPIRLDDAVMESNKAWAALIRRTRNIGDFTRWKDHDSYQKALDRLLRALKAEEKKV